MSADAAEGSETAAGEEQRTADGLTHAEVMRKVIDMQLGLAELSSKVDVTKTENGKLRDENATLRDYLGNLMAKVSKMPHLGTLAPSRAKVQHEPDSAYGVRVNDHIGELWVPMDD
mmetsp:Transcript_115590/g.338128  ORF Transcript_115590/g.338128 Transcript_115590/m.338128 type:complete len:116 (+) Transcript_115590:77-424(+)